MSDIKDLVAKCEKKFADAGLISGSVSANGELARADKVEAFDLLCWVQEDKMLMLWPARCKGDGVRLADCKGHVLWRTGALSRLFHTLVKETAAYNARSSTMRAALQEFLDE